MKDSIWAYFIIMFGIIAIVFIFFMQRTTTTDQHNYTLLRETTEAAMYDAIDIDAYNESGIVRIDQDRFVELFLKRFAENASLSRAYVIDIYDINEEPPKVSIKVSSTEKGTSEIVDFDLVNKVDAILETKYWKEIIWED